MEQQSRLHHLMIAINRWRELPRCNQRVIASEIVSAAKSTGLIDPLEDEGIIFNFKNDAYENQRLDAKKVFSWFGQFEDSNVSLPRLFCAEQAIVAAMPEDIRLNYLNSIYGMADVMVCPKPKATTSMELLTEAIPSMIKESSEAQIACIEASNNPDKTRVQKAYKELSESVLASSNAMGNLEQEHPEWTGKSCPLNSLKAV